MSELTNTESSLTGTNSPLIREMNLEGRWMKSVRPRSAEAAAEPRGTVVVMPTVGLRASAPQGGRRTISAEAIITVEDGRRYSFQTVNVSPRGFFVSASTLETGLQLSTSYPVQLVYKRFHVNLRAELVHVGDGITGIPGYGFRITTIGRMDQANLEALLGSAPAAHEPTMSGPSWRLLAGLVAALVVAAAAIVVVLIVATSSRLVVEVVPAREATIDEILSSGTGEIAAKRSVVVRSPFPAPMLIETLVEPGARVKAGDVVARAADPDAPPAKPPIKRDPSRQLTAPFEGVIADVAAHQGELVPPSGAIMEIIDNSQLRANVPFGEGDAARIAVGMAARVTLPGAAETSGTVDGMGVVARPLADGRGGKAVLISISVPTDAGARAGSTVRAEVALPERTGVMVPASAIFRDGSRSYVWTLVGRSGPLGQVHVQTGAKVGAMVEIAGDELAVGTSVVRDAEVPGLKRGLIVKAQ